MMDMLGMQHDETDDKGKHVCILPGGRWTYHTCIDGVRCVLHALHFFNSRLPFMLSPHLILVLTQALPHVFAISKPSKPPRHPCDHKRGTGKGHPSCIPASDESPIFRFMSSFLRLHNGRL